MKISNIFFLNNWKFLRNTNKALFLVIPVVVLVALSVLVSSQVDNIQKGLESSVFDTISDQYTLLTVRTESESNDPGNMFRGQSSFEQNKFSGTDISNINAISGVKNSSLEITIPNVTGKSGDLFEGKSIFISTILTMDDVSASLYSNEDFTYEAGSPIPIILNASTFTYSYEDWSSGDTVTVEMGNPGEMGEGKPEEGRNRMNVTKSEAIEYDESELLGKVFTISFGGLSDIQSYTTTMDRDTRTMTISKLSDDEYNQKVEERKESISQYWDYDKISSPVEYSFVVVGVIKDETSRNTYIPYTFAEQLMADMISNEMNARIVETIPSDVLNSDFLGTTYDGDELASSNMGGMMGQIGNRMGGGMGQRPEGDIMSSFSAISIPGLVINVDSNSNVIGTLDDPEVFSYANKYSDSINVVLESVMDRDGVIKELNSKGYAYQDLGDLEVFENLEGTLNTVTKVFFVSFVFIISSVIILTMGKFVSESTREIGIFRSTGMKKSDILVLFFSQSLLCVSVGYLVGVVLGVLLNLGVSRISSIWFNNFVENTVSKTFNVVNSVDPSLFSNISWNSVLLYTLVLFVVSSMVSIIPSSSASKISPVEAIKGE